MAFLQAMMVAALLTSGMGAALLGSIKVPLARKLQIDEVRIGGLVSIFGFILIPVIGPAGMLTDLVGKKIVLLTGSVVFSISLAVLASARSYPIALTAVLLLGGAWSLLVNVGNVLTPLAFPGDTAYATNLACVFFGMGAFLTPLVTSFLLGRMPLSTVLMLLAGLALAPTLLAFGVDFEALGGTTTANALSEPANALLTNTTLWLCGLAFFFYGPLEASMGAWTTTYLGDQGVRETTASTMLSAFWLMLMASRLLTAFALPKGKESVFIVCLAVACTLVLAGIVMSRSAGVSMALVMLAGFVFGPIFPTLMAILLDHVDPASHGRAVGIFFAIGGIGWTFIPILIGMYARRTSVQRGFAIAVAAAVGLSLLSFALAVL